MRWDCTQCWLSAPTVTRYFVSHCVMKYDFRGSFCFNVPHEKFCCFYCIHVAWRIKEVVNNVTDVEGSPFSHRQEEANNSELKGMPLVCSVDKFPQDHLAMSKEEWKGVKYSGAINFVLAPVQSNFYFSIMFIWPQPRALRSSMRCYLLVF